jgi:hypothetical protein
VLDVARVFATAPRCRRAPVRRRSHRDRGDGQEPRARPRLSIVVLAGLAWLGRAALTETERAAAASPEVARVRRGGASPRRSARSRCRTTTAVELGRSHRASRGSACPRSVARRAHGIAGRLVESDGKPAADVEVALLELRYEELPRRPRHVRVPRRCARARRSRARTPTPRAASTSPAPVRTATTRWRELHAARACRCA